YYVLDSCRRCCSSPPRVHEPTRCVLPRSGRRHIPSPERSCHHRKPAVAFPGAHSESSGESASREIETDHSCWSNSSSGSEDHRCDGKRGPGDRMPLWKRNTGCSVGNEYSRRKEGHQVPGNRKLHR